MNLRGKSAKLYSFVEKENGHPQLSSFAVCDGAYGGKSLLDTPFCPGSFYVGKKDLKMSVNQTLNSHSACNNIGTRNDSRKLLQTTQADI